MKTILTTLLFLLSLNLTANELKWVDEQIEAIKPPRSGISRTKINSIPSPFIFLSKNKKEDENKAKSSSIKKSKSKKAFVSSSTTKNTINKQSKKLVLNAIINKSALINNEWYKIDDKIGRYTLSSINKTSVMLSYQKKRVITLDRYSKFKTKI